MKIPMHPATDTANVAPFVKSLPVFRSERRTYGGRLFAVTIRRADNAVIAWTELEVRP